MVKLFRKFLQEDSGQDLVEYTLLISFIALASAGMFLGGGGSLAGIWTTANSQLAVANLSAS